MNSGISYTRNTTVRQWQSLQHQWEGRSAPLYSLFITGYVFLWTLCNSMTRQVNLWTMNQKGKHHNAGDNLKVVPGERKARQEHVIWSKVMKHHIHQKGNGLYLLLCCSQRTDSFTGALMCWQRHYCWYAAQSNTFSIMLRLQLLNKNQLYEIVKEVYNWVNVDDAENVLI